jgi:hypothetical protein
MFRTSKWIAAVLLIAAPVIAEDRTEKTLSGTVDYEGGTVTVEHGFGRLTVHTWSRNEVNARGMIRSSDPDLDKSFRFTVTNGSNGVTVRAIAPSIHIHGSEDVSYSADVDVTIPERAPLKLRSRFGAVQVSGLRAPAEIVNSQGSIEVRDIDGGRIENRFGSIVVYGSDDNTTVQNANGSIDIKDVHGQLTVANRFASVSVERVDGGLSVSNSNGTVTATDVKGPTSINSSFAPVTARNIGGPMSVANNNGNVTALNIAGDLSVDTRFGLVKAERIRGSLTVENSNGGVSATDINGSAHVKTTFASVFLRGVDGAVDVENQNGAIGVSGLRGGCNSVSLRTTYSPIKIAIGSNAGYTVSARTTYGMITTEVPVTATSRSSNDNSSSLSGTIGSGGCRMDLTTSNGGITITRE